MSGNSIIISTCAYVPKVFVEIEVARFVKSASIDDTDTIVVRTDTQILRPDSDHRPESLMSFVQHLFLSIPIAKA